MNFLLLMICVFKGMNIEKITVVFLVLLPILGACDSTFKWKEEIRLHDGRLIFVDRVDVLGGWHEPGQSASKKNVL